MDILVSGALMEMYIHSLVLTAGIVIALHHWSIEKACGYMFIIELASGLGITMLYAGSYHGLFVAAISTFLLSIYLGVYRWWNGMQILTRKGWVYRPY